MSSALRQLRIIAIPLTRPNTTGTVLKAKPSRLVYYQFQITVPRLKPSSTRLASGDQENETVSVNTKKTGWWLPEEGIVKWTTHKLADTWAGFGKKKSGWQVRFSILRPLAFCSIQNVMMMDEFFFSFFNRLGLLFLAESIPGWRTADGPYGL